MKATVEQIGFEQTSFNSFIIYCHRIVKPMD